MSYFNKIVFVIILIIFYLNSIVICNQTVSTSTIINDQVDTSRTLNGNTTNLTGAELIASILGPKLKPPLFRSVMSITYIIIFLCGLCGNLCVCCVVICNNCMHTTTNYYLFSLAVSDVLSLTFGLPPELYGLLVGGYPWAFGHIFCVIRTFVFETTTIASVLTILAFTFERWLHICKPMFAQKMSNSFSRALKIILLMWILSGLLAIPYPVGTGVENYVPNEPDSELCKPLNKYQQLMTTLLLFSSILLFIVPMTLISLMYILIGVTLWESQNKRKNFSNYYQSTTKSNVTNSSSVVQLSYEQKQPLTDSTNFKFGGNLLVNNRKNLNSSEFSICDNSTTNSNTNNNERRSKELEYISYKTKQSRRDVVKMLFVVVLCFFLCWAPHHLQRIMSYAYTQRITNNMSVPKLMENMLEFLYYTSGILVYISSTINPVLYNVMSKRYRTAFKNTISMIFTCSCSSKSRAYKKSNLYYSKNNVTIYNRNRNVPAISRDNNSIIIDNNNNNNNNNNNKATNNCLNA